MINLYGSIAKLQNLQQATSGRGTSLPSTLEDIADFLRHDLTDIIIDLQQQQIESDKRNAEYENEIKMLENQLALNYELNKSIEGDRYASAKVS
ncbi:hypothetical protein SD70_27725 [Gordoniibacillus kamchatkensis]|uniref:Uncharacterized protein n=1 Tax=Gordoniibacillus kamchatkensis TaxID=1590651 RepID=A0ABR5AAY3_9BACL|nr:hypothetical protein [Paenibacillus sp. VKM B-2647]KIL38219.1 hypothetical protein SD70_27725 [Paenibacillus sp. VKM B-2647]